MDERLESILAFIKEIDKEKTIIRQTLLADGSRKETDAEHAWHLAIMAILLKDYANEEIDLLHTVEMVLMHDLIEVYAGDTYAYDEKGNATKEARELEAAKKQYSILPEDLAEKYFNLWREFEEGATPEAKFAFTLDHIQPTMLNHANNGASWLEHDVRAQQVIKRNEKTHEGSEVLWDYAFKNWIKPHIGKELKEK